MFVGIKKQAFSLIELSIVLVIISIITAAALSTATSNSYSNKVQTSRDNMEKIYKAMGAYLLVNKKLPCPARLTLDKNDINYGVANTGTDCDSSAGVYTTTNLAYGAVPTQDLEIPSEFAEDGFGNKIGYIIHKGFASTLTRTAGGYTYSDATTPTTVTNPASIIQINDTTTAVETQAVFALVSYGINRNGAFLANSTTQNSLPVNTTSEYSNVIDSGASPYYDNVLVFSSSTDSNFDDMLFYKTRAQLINDFNAQEAIPCSASVDYGQNVGVTSCSNPSGYKSLKKCGPFGVYYTSFACTS